MERRSEVLVLGIGNVLWADEGFGVRAVEALHARYAFPAAVEVVDGGTQGLYLYGLVAAARRVLVFDAIDFGLAPGTLKTVRDADVPAASPSKMSPHQTGFNDVLALAALSGRSPEAVTLIGVQPEELEDLGGSLRDVVRARIPEAIALAARELARWGFPGVARAPGSVAPRLNATALAQDDYERGRPSAAEACRIGDARVLAAATRTGGG